MTSTFASWLGSRGYLQRLAIELSNSCLRPFLPALLAVTVVRKGTKNTLSGLFSRRDESPTSTNLEALSLCFTATE